MIKIKCIDENSKLKDIIIKAKLCKVLQNLVDINSISFTILGLIKWYKAYNNRKWASFFIKV